MALPNPSQPNPPGDKLVLVIDDDEIMRLSCEQILRKAGYRVETFGSGRDGIRRLEEVNPQILVVDIKMPELNGFEVIDIVRKINPDLVIVVITGYATIETAVDAMKAGAYDFLPKPFTPNELRLIVDRGLERWRLIKETERLRREKDEVERRFITLVSHQLKSPLVAVKQYLDVLLHSSQNQLPEKADEWVSRSQARLAEMLTLIQDWLALSKIERGTFCDRSASSRLAPIVDEIVEGQRLLPVAAGITIEPDKIDQFAAEFEAYARQNLNREDETAKLYIDALVPLSEFRKEMVSELQLLGPFGQGNSEPTFATKGVRLAGPPKRVGAGREHLQLAITDNTATIRCIGFRFGKLEKKLLEHDFFDVAYQPQINTYNGNSSVEFVLTDVQFE